VVDHDEDPPPHPAAAAANWRSVLVADAALGVVAMAVGLAMVAWWSVVLGAGIASLGLAYLAMVGRRGRLWAAWRARQGW
jgi:hypothetical protein